MHLTGWSIAGAVLEVPTRCTHCTQATWTVQKELVFIVSNLVFKGPI
jgi:hypothetical protein